MKCRPLCSMPHTRTVILPFLTAMIGLVLSFRSLASCDLIITDWNIDCSTPERSCVYQIQLGVGLLAKETLIAVEEGREELILDGNDENMDKVCKWYTNEEKEWLQSENIWKISILACGICCCIGVLGIIILGSMSCIQYREKLVKATSALIGLCAFLSPIPFLLYFNTRLCLTQFGLCDPSETNCVQDCTMGMSSFQLIAATCVWLGSALTVWTVAPAKPTTITIQTTEISKKEKKKKSKADGSNVGDADDSPSNHTESSTDSSSDESEVESKGDDDAV